MVIEFFPTLYENDITQRDFCLGWNMKGKGFVVGFFQEFSSSTVKKRCTNT